MATLGAATVMRRERDLGTIEVGKTADLVLVSGRPDQHISDIRRPRYVSKEGKLYAVADLDRVVALQQRPNASANQLARPAARRQGRP
jgi:cytosine/adenosine deaminase-related metal-dependent hydrolase